MENSNNYGVSLAILLQLQIFGKSLILGNFYYQTFTGEIGQTSIDIETTLWDFQFKVFLNYQRNLLIDLTYFQQSDWIWRGIS